MKNSYDIYLFEDQGFEWLLPLVWTRPVYELRSGALSIREKVTALFPDAGMVLHARAYLAPALRERYPDLSVNSFPDVPRAGLFVNGRLLPDKTVVHLIRRLMREGEFLLMRQDLVAAAFLYAHRVREIPLQEGLPLSRADFPEDILTLSVDVPTLFRYPWDLVCRSPEQLLYDRTLGVLSTSPITEVPYGVAVLNASEVHVGPHVRIYPGVVLDAEDGPIVLDEHVTIMPGAYVQGPVAIRRGALVKPHAKIYEGSLIGPVVKVGGEVEATIIQGYTNKQHEGFLGHAYVGEWVNLGAGTNNSDLKNNYSSVRVFLRGCTVDTELTFWGLIAGDHTKTAIGTQLNTGTVLGVSCNVFGAGFPPRYMPSFSWGGAQGFVTYELPRALEVASRVMARRHRVLTEAEADVLRYVYAATEHERQEEPV